MKSNWIFIVLAVIVAFFVVYQAQGENVDPTITDDLSDSDIDDTENTLTNSADSSNPLFAALAAAIKASENVPLFHNNPYALTAGAANEVGAEYTPNTTGGVVVNFPTLQDGIDAGLSFISAFAVDHSDLPIGQAVSTYVNGPNSPITINGIASGVYAGLSGYITNVSKALGVSDPNSTTLGGALGL